MLLTFCVIRSFRDRRERKGESNIIFFFDIIMDGYWYGVCVCDDAAKKTGGNESILKSDCVAVNIEYRVNV